MIEINILISPAALTPGCDGVQETLEDVNIVMFDVVHRIDDSLSS